LILVVVIGVVGGVGTAGVVVVARLLVRFVVIAGVVGVSFAEPDRDFSWTHSQWRASMEWARIFMSFSEEGFPCCPMTSLMRLAKPE